MLFVAAGQKAPFKGSFTEVVSQTMMFLRKNPALVAKYHWPTEQHAVENWIDETNAQRMLAHGWLNFVADETFSVEKKTLAQQPHSLLGKLVHAAGAVKTAALAYKDLFVNGPAPQDLAESRARTCVACPLNDTESSLSDLFVESAAHEISALIQLVKDTDMRTLHDDDLGICRACGCPMKVKVHSRIEKLSGVLQADVWDKLNKDNPKCWLLSETGR